MTNNNCVVAVYKLHTEAEAAINELQKSGFDMKKLSIIGRDYHTDEHVVGYYNAGDRMKYWGKLGAFWGGFWGLLFGSAFFFVPGVGPLLFAGPIVSYIVGALEGAVIVGGFSALGAGLYSMGIPKNSMIQYETAVKSGKYVLIAHGSDMETIHAREILKHTDHVRSLPDQCNASFAARPSPVQVQSLLRPPAGSPAVAGSGHAGSGTPRTKVFQEQGWVVPARDFSAVAGAAPVARGRAFHCSPQTRGAPVNQLSAAAKGFPAGRVPTPVAT